MYESEYQTTCPDCGVTHFKDAPCPYCYEVVERYTVKSGNSVLYRGYEEAAAEAAYTRAVEIMDAEYRAASVYAGTRLPKVAGTRSPRRHRPGWNVERDVVINRRADHPYED